MSPIAINGSDKQGIGVNGIQVKQALIDTSSTVNKGVYNATLLETVDSDLATANIKSGITLFGKAGSTDVRDSTDANAAITDVKDSKTFYAGGGARKTGTMPTVTLDPINDIVAAGYYAATTLHDVDGNLAVGNIKSGVTIFGFLGTLSSTLAEDIVASSITALTGAAGLTTMYYLSQAVGSGAGVDLVSNTSIFDANSMAVAVGYVYCWCGVANAIKVRLYMDGVQVAESAYLTGSPAANIIVVGTKALSGSKICKVTAWNYAVGSQNIALCAAIVSGAIIACGIGVGSIKVT